MDASSSGRYISPRFRGHHGLGKALVPRTSIPFLRATLRDRVRPARARGGKSKDKGEGQGEDSQHRAREPLGPGRPLDSTGIRPPGSPSCTSIPLPYAR